MYRLLFFITGIMLATACNKMQTNSPYSKDQVYKQTFQNVRLGDGVPIGVEISVRWSINNVNKFLKHFDDAQTYSQNVLHARERETLNRVANQFESVDEVFTDERDQFIKAIKKAFRNQLGEEGIEIKEIILSDIIFPVSFTKSMEQVSLKERELEAIRLASLGELEKAKTKAEEAKANGKVQIEEARVEGEIARMQARIEQQKRQAKIEEAETSVRVAEKKAVGEAKRLEILSNAEVARQRQLHSFNFGKDTSLAKVYSEHPAYANYLINKELASKVKVAIIPPHTNANSILKLDNEEKKSNEDNDFNDEY